ncbi:MAG: arsenate reductase ArsC [Candidatus Krumholzibacteria bacterium]|nr:arsenate reductase ArsC [Candidatus Krumholzibacteria bacterium]
MRVLFICTANSCRSQMAEAWAHKLFPADWTVLSGGLLTYPISDNTRGAMAEVGLDMAGQKTKTFDQFDLDSFDLVVTLSNEASRYLPRLADPERHLRRPVSDPMSATGSTEEIQTAFRRGRDLIKMIVQDILTDSSDI